MISKCKLCEQFSSANCKEPLIPHSLPKRPWQKIGTDILEYGGKKYLVMVKYYSKWTELFELINKKSKSVIKSFIKAFATFGSFKIITSSPHYPKSNGLTERSVGIVKNMLSKTEDIQIALLNYRSTLITGLNQTPSQLFMNRNLKSKIPDLNKKLNF